MLRTKNTFSYYIYIWIGIFIICFLLWNRLFREREPRDLTFYLNNIPFTILFFLVAIFLLLTLYYIRKILRVPIKQESILYKILLYLNDKALVVSVLSFLKRLADSPKQLYSYLTERTDIEGLFAYVIENIIYPVTTLKRKSLAVMIYLLFFFLPKFVVVSTLLLDVIVFHKLHFFFESLWLLLIPVCMSASIYMVTSLCDKNIAFFKGHLNYDDNSEEEFTNITLKVQQPTFEGALDITKIDLYSMVDLIDIYTDVKFFLLQITEDTSSVKLVSHFFISLSYLLAWSYILFYILT